MIDPIAAESCLVAIGLPALLDAHPRWGVGVRGMASAVSRNIRKALQTFLTQGQRQDVADLPSFDYGETRDLLDGASGNAEKIATALFAAIDDHDLGQQIADNATRIVHLLSAALPRKVRSAVDGDVPETPSATEVARFARQWQVAVDPMIVLRDLNEHSLSADQAMAFEAFYPTLYALTRETLLNVLVDVKARRATWTLDGQRDRLLRTLLGASAHDPGIAADFQAMMAAGPQAPKGPAPSAGATASPSLATPGQADPASAR